MQGQFYSSVTETQAREEVLLAIQRVGDGDITDIASMTSVADIFTNPKDQNSLVRTWVLFDGHENTLIWDTQTIPCLLLHSDAADDLLSLDLGGSRLVNTETHKVN